MTNDQLPVLLLTIRRISQVTRRPVSEIRRVLDEHPEILPAAVADLRPVFDLDAFRAIREALREQCEVAQ